MFVNTNNERGKYTKKKINRRARQYVYRVALTQLIHTQVKQTHAKTMAQKAGNETQNTTKIST